MRTVSAFRAEDGSLHETRDAAALADLAALGFDAPTAGAILGSRDALTRVFQQVSGLAYIPAYFPEPVPEPLAAE